jgi:hypothetical protein
MKPLTPATAHVDLLRTALGGNLTEKDALLWMVLLHTHDIYLSVAVVDDAWKHHAKDGIVKLSPHTQRGVAAAIAELWTEIKTKRGRDLGPRSDYTFWYSQYTTLVPYETVEDIPVDSRHRLEELRSRLAQDARIVAVNPEE